MKLLRVALGLLLATSALAQTTTRQTPVYRCGPDGRDLRDSPCPGPHASSQPISFDEPSAADSRAARERHVAEARQAAALATARRASEAEARRQRHGPTLINTLPPPAQPASAARDWPPRPPKAAKHHKTPKPPAAAGSASVSGAGR
ncbi:MAG: hypothetical protein DI603_11720 [Roseateles depolymerans]|uniref:DUF4124 domain-containing protein n=1 Tax=Roseateles depolymerans TaxID=76731 RepID=A0A2W5DN17_9BURK|nr:MAG: hypothetical protein DI603_11720 [Roseateles depolymerans]